VKSAAWQHHGRPDLLLLGGDLAQDELASSYRWLADEITGWGRRTLVTPGNHCDLGALERALLPPLGMPPLARHEARLGAWLVIALNSHDPNLSPGGRLGRAELARLQGLLAETDAAHVLLALHHHPAPIGSPWMDAMMLADADALWAAALGSGKVRAMLFGHVHQAFDAEREGVRLLGSPSTCIQFRPGTDDFELDDASPGWRWLRLHEDGGLETGVARIAGFRPTDLSDNARY
ncbi:MAG: metallophosphoesterase, partial [Mariprofundaceae bacterium]